MGWFRIDRVTWVERGLWVTVVGATVAPLALRPTPQEVVRGYVEAVDRAITARLRFSFSAAHPDDAITRLAELVRTRVLGNR